MKKLLLIIFIISIGCSGNKVVKNHGSNALEKKFDKIKISETNKNDVQDILGKPSTVSLFDNNLWYYIEREKVTQSPFKLGKTKIIKNDILEISFNNYGIVKSKKLYEIEDMNKLKTAKEVTQKDYNKKTYLDKVLTSIKQKIDAPKNKK